MQWIKAGLEICITEAESRDYRKSEIIASQNMSYYQAPALYC